MDLRLKLDDTDFDKLTEKARAMIPALAPEWTDHNIHDPGIMLLELMAWVAEAQIYSLSRIRRDERLAYAHLLGIEQGGPRPASGLIWPLEPDEPGYQPGVILGQSIPEWTAVAGDRSDIPTFRLHAAQHLTPAALTRVVTHFANGQIADNTRINRRNGATFLPFGASPSPADQLILSFSGDAIAPGGTGDFVLGVEVDRPLDIPLAAASQSSRLVVAMRDASGERPLALKRDTTAGLRRSGVLVLDIDENEQTRAPAQSDRWFDLILTPRAAGFLRTLRLRRIASNVLWVEQIEQVIDEESFFGQGLPGQTYRLTRTGRLTDQELTVAITGQTWTQVDNLSHSDPDAPHFEFDEARRQILFGNGINGKVPAAGASLRISYAVCSGVQGNVPAGIAWMLRGVMGTFGRNSEPCAGASDAVQLDDLQAAARRSLAKRVVYVTPADLEHAAEALADLQVVRALELPPLSCQLRGTRTLLAVAAAASETALWLEAIRARLAPGIPAGQHLDVIAPRYVGLRIAAKLMVPATVDAAKIKAQAQAMLRARFVGPAAEPIWKFGRDLTLPTVRGWLQKLDGVASVGETTVYRDGVAQPDKVAIGAIELPRFETVDSDIVVERQTVGSAP